MHALWIRYDLSTEKLQYTTALLCYITFFNPYRNLEFNIQPFVTIRVAFFALFQQEQ